MLHINFSRRMWATWLYDFLWHVLYTLNIFCIWGNSNGTDVCQNGHFGELAWLVWTKTTLVLFCFTLSELIFAEIMSGLCIMILKRFVEAASSFQGDTHPEGTFFLKIRQAWTFFICALRHLHLLLIGITCADRERERQRERGREKTSLHEHLCNCWSITWKMRLTK